VVFIVGTDKVCCFFCYDFRFVSLWLGIFLVIAGILDSLVMQPMSNRCRTFQHQRHIVSKPKPLGKDQDQGAIGVYIAFLRLCCRLKLWAYDRIVLVCKRLRACGGSC